MSEKQWQRHRQRFWIPPHQDSFPGPPAPQNNSPKSETDTETLLARRQKQIDMGKNHPDYQLYLACIPQDDPRRKLPECPKTPDKHRKYSRRAFDGLIREWKINVHKWATDVRNETERHVANL